MTKTRWKALNPSIKEFLFEIKGWGLKTALKNYLILFTKWAVGAKRIQLTYPRKK